MSKRRLKPEEQRAWARVARSVKALPGRAAHAPPAETRPARQTAADDAPAYPEAFLQEAVNAYPPRLAPPADRGKEKRVRRGQAAIHGRFDLHGHTQESAAAALPVFLASQRGQGARCVLIITGKGKLGEGVLKRNFLRWLETPEARALVSGYAQAHAKHGGAGAFYVFLRRL